MQVDASPGVAIVTGAGQGIGRQIALELGGRGFVVAVNDLDTATQTIEDLNEMGTRTVSVPGDVADEGSVRRIVETILSSEGRIDVLVNNAGISLQRRAEDMDFASWERVIAVNLTGPFLLCRDVGRTMLSQGSGSIVNIASIAGQMGFADRVAYNCSKHGVIGLTRTLAVEWGGRGVRVNAVCPGWVKTEMDARDQARSGNTELDITNRIPMARFASPQDIARAVAFLADHSMSSFVNGQCLTVDGGWSADGGWETLRLSHR